MSQLDDLRHVPWCWTMLGSAAWKLVTRHGGSKVVLAALRGSRPADPPRLVVRSLKDGRLVELTPDHPLGRALVALPELVQICEATANRKTPDGEDLTVDAARRVMQALGEWEETTDAAA